MKYTVIVSEEALEDIQAVFHYISDKECLPATARRWVDSLETAVNALNYQPYRYPQYEIQIPEFRRFENLSSESIWCCIRSMTLSSSFPCSG